MMKRLRTQTIGWIATAWTVIVVAFLVWQTINYRGIVAILAEWQFATFDRFFPIATIAILLFLLTLPFTILIALRLRRTSRSRREAKIERSLYRAGLFNRFLAICVIASVAIAGVLTVLGLSVGGFSNKARTVAIADPNTPRTGGPAILNGTVLYDRMGFYREGFVITSRELWVAPIVRTIDSEQIAFFVETQHAKAGQPRAGSFEGVLRRRAMPGGLATLYRNSGYSVPRETYVLFSSQASAQWPYLSASADFFLMALFFGIVLLLHRRHIRKLCQYRDQLHKAP